MDSQKKEVIKSQWTLLLGLVLVALIIGATAFVISDQSYSDRESQVEKLANSPMRYYGDQVTLSGDVDSVIGTRAVTVTGPGIISDTVLVISKTPLVPIGGGDEDSFFNAGTRVFITGEARSFDRTELERELEVELDDQEFEKWNGRPVIVADTIYEDR